MKYWKRIAAAACVLLFSAAPAGCAYRGDELGAPAQPEALSFAERQSEGLSALKAGAADFSARFAAAAYAARFVSLSCCERIFPTERPSQL